MLHEKLINKAIEIIQEHKDTISFIQIYIGKDNIQQIFFEDQINEE